MAFDPEKFAEGLHEYLARAFKPVAARIKAIEAKAAEQQSTIQRLSKKIAKLEERGNEKRR